MLQSNRNKTVITCFKYRYFINIINILILKTLTLKVDCLRQIFEVSSKTIQLMVTMNMQSMNIPVEETNFSVLQKTDKTYSTYLNGHEVKHLTTI